MKLSFLITLCVNKKNPSELLLSNSRNLSPDDRKVGNIDSLKDFFAMLNLELNGCITKKDILFTLLIANELDFEFIFKNLCAL